MISAVVIGPTASGCTVRIVWISAPIVPVSGVMRTSGSPSVRGVGQRHGRLAGSDGEEPEAFVAGDEAVLVASSHHGTIVGSVHLAGAVELDGAGEHVQQLVVAVGMGRDVEPRRQLGVLHVESELTRREPLAAGADSRSFGDEPCGRPAGGSVF